MRQDFWTNTSNKQLNFLKHVKTILKIKGWAAIAVSDNVLFEGGADEHSAKEAIESLSGKYYVVEPYYREGTTPDQLT